MTDFDSPWKDALDLYFQAFLALFFPHIHADIDWSRGYESLDKELQQLEPKDEQGRRYPDKLFRVWTRDGTEQWVLIHIEVQTMRETGFPRRIYVYNYRIEARYDRDVVSLAVLADDDPSWRPGRYVSERWGCRKQLDFLPVKLLDYRGREAELEASANPFAKVLLAHLKAQETRGNDLDRQTWKLRLVRGLFERGLSAEDVRQLFRLIDWLLELPKPHDSHFWDEVKRIQEEKRMPFITTPERIGMEKGMEKGMKEGLEKGMKEGLEKGRTDGILVSIEEMLRARFGEEALRAVADIRALSGEDKLRAVLRAVGTAATLEEASRSWVSLL